ncbi:CaiB/BaiF CoA-transferase family protein [Desulfosporosinus sp. BICA1-9]|uniref:CaiB/BaiF CoA transferase family protein n=1 Tax=Desulfosporosinus sp. BICA1-9 TaxID=1531958 RepID=UPI000B2301F1|nr:CoA transferase [Desulfosporosinus sp. BICA1-9]
MKPLEGLKVIELANFVAGPTCARALANWGAEVIKVESLAGDPLRRIGINTKMPTFQEENPNFDLANIGKKAIALNLKTVGGMAIFEKLLETSDVFITNNRTQSLEKMGLNYEQLQEKYPQLIFAQVLGYGEKGPLKDKPGYDFTAYYARGGLLGTLYEKGTSPLNPVPGFGDNQVAMSLVGGILAALYKRNNTGFGDKVTVSLYHSALFAMSTAVTSLQYGFTFPISRKEVGNPFLNTYRTKDDRWLQLAAPEYERLFQGMMQAVGREDLISIEKYCKFNSISENTTEIIEIIEAQIAKKTADEWMAIFEKFDIPCEKALLWDEILNDEQAWENGFLHEMHYKTGNAGTLVDLPVKFASLGKVEHQRGPLIGENTVQILKNLGYSEDEISKMTEAREIV